MRNMINSTTTSLLLSLAPLTTLASPVFTYDFDVTSYDCFLSDCSDEGYYRGKLESMTLVLTQQAVTDKEAKLHYTTDFWNSTLPWSALNTTNQGFSSTELGAWNTSLDFTNGICQANWKCNIQATLDIFTTEFLQGLFRLDTNNDNVHINSSGSNSWSGYIYSDGPLMTYAPNRFPTFTGEWRLRNKVPEPGSVFLFLTALAGAGLFFRRKPS